MNYGTETCRRCEGAGRTLGESHCPGCLGAGAVLVAQPPRLCAQCNGRGRTTTTAGCSACDSCGFALRYVGNGAVVEEVRKLQQSTLAQVTELGSVTYGIGVCVSLGANLAMGNGLGAFLVCWLSWLNVGWVLGLITPAAQALQNSGAT